MWWELKNAPNFSIQELQGEKVNWLFSFIQCFDLECLALSLSLPLYLSFSLSLYIRLVHVRDFQNSDFSILISRLRFFSLHSKSREWGGKTKGNALSTFEIQLIKARNEFKMNLSKHYQLRWNAIKLHDFLILRDFSTILHLYKQHF